MAASRAPARSGAGARAGVSGGSRGSWAHQMAAGLKQAAALDRKQRGAADRQLGAELLGGEPGGRGGHGSRGCRGGGSGGGYPRVGGFAPRRGSDGRGQW